MDEIVELHINSYDDRRTLVAILADNGYPTYIEDRQDAFRHEFYVHVYKRQPPFKGEEKSEEERC